MSMKPVSPEDLEKLQKELSELDVEQLQQMETKLAASPAQKQIRILIQEEIERRTHFQTQVVSGITLAPSLSYNDDEEAAEIQKGAPTPSPNPQNTQSVSDEDEKNKQDNSLRTAAITTAAVASTVAVGATVAGGMEKPSTTLGARSTSPRPVLQPAPQLQPSPLTVTSKSSAPQPTPGATDTLRITAADMQNPQEFMRKILLLMQRPGEGGRGFAERVSETLQEVEDKLRKTAGKVGQSVTSLNVSSAKEMASTVAHQARHVATLAVDLLRNPNLHNLVLGILSGGAKKLQELMEENRPRKTTRPEMRPKGPIG